MTKYLASAALAAVIGAAAFAAPASAQGFSVNVGGPGYHDGYRDGPHYGPRPGVRVYTGRAAYRDDCFTKREVKYRNGKRIVTEREICR